MQNEDDNASNNDKKKRKQQVDTNEILTCVTCSRRWFKDLLKNREACPVCHAPTDGSAIYFCNIDKLALYSMKSLRSFAGKYKCPCVACNKGSSAYRNCVKCGKTTFADSSTKKHCNQCTKVTETSTTSQSQDTGLVTPQLIALLAERVLGNNEQLSVLVMQGMLENALQMQQVADALRARIIIARIGPDAPQLRFDCATGSLYELSLVLNNGTYSMLLPVAMIPTVIVPTILKNALSVLVNMMTAAAPIPIVAPIPPTVQPTSTQPAQSESDDDDEVKPPKNKKARHKDGTLVQNNSESEDEAEEDLSKRMASQYI